MTFVVVVVRRMFSDITFHENAFNGSELLHMGRRNDGQKDNQTDKLKLTGAFSQMFLANAPGME
jgi:hypothetical protein